MLLLVNLLKTFTPKDDLAELSDSLVKMTIKPAHPQTLGSPAPSKQQYP
ncbi:hypothetical protein [uncultured Gammaproteobacteria bacterium]|nr:hypothetical protein [uncultured Gammaproteobacteria bacterium]